MSKGTRVDLFNTGDRVTFQTNIGHKVYRKDKDKNGKVIQVFSHKIRILVTNFGRIVKLHRSGRQGVAEIRPESNVPVTDMKKVSRRLQFVEKA